MIGQLRGTLLEKQPPRLVLDVGGLVYAGLQSTPWGEPRHIAMQPKVRLLASAQP